MYLESPKYDEETSKNKNVSYRVVRNDTLWSIAKRTRPRGTSILRHMNLSPIGDNANGKEDGKGFR